MSRRLAGQRLAWAIVGALVGFVACRPEPAARIHEEDFETLCDGVPCGWERTSGRADQATWIETIHPGEHGLRLEGETSVRGPGGPPLPSFDPRFLSLALTARCDAGSSLRVEVAITDDAGDTFFGFAIVTPAAEWEPPVPVTLTTDILRANATRVMAVGISKTGEGVCEVSELAIDKSSFTPGC